MKVSQVLKRSLVNVSWYKLNSFGTNQDKQSVINLRNPATKGDYSFAVALIKVKTSCDSLTTVPLWVLPDRF